MGALIIKKGRRKHQGSTGKWEKKKYQRQKGKKEITKTKGKGKKSHVPFKGEIFLFNPILQGKKIPVGP